MFRCNNCDTTTHANQKTNCVVVEKRQKNYYKTEHSYNEDGNPISVQGKLEGVGYEIVKEIRVCDNCYSNMKGYVNV